MRKLLVATSNPGKFREISEGLADLGLELLSLADFSGVVPVRETGKTFEENAILKARGYGDQTKLPTVADDAGLEIDALSGEPGVKTRRWIYPVTPEIPRSRDTGRTIYSDQGFEDAPRLSAGSNGVYGDRDSTDEELIEYALKRLKGVPQKKRTARLRTVIAFYDGREIFTSTAAIEGNIIERAPKEVEPGYPFRSLLFILKFGKLYKDLTPDEHEECNHRLTALNQLKPVIAAKVI